MSNQLGVEMTVLRSADRNILMKGMVLRRLTGPLTRSQLDVGIEQDVIEIKRRFSTFDFEAYTGCDLDSFYAGMTAAMLINQRDVGGKTLYERGKLAGEFDASLSADMEWMVEALPMSTRGFFDQLKRNPDRKITVDVNDFIEDHNDSKKRIITDHALNKAKQGRAVFAIDRPRARILSVLRAVPNMGWLEAKQCLDAARATLEDLQGLVDDRKVLCGDKSEDMGPSSRVRIE